MIYIARVHSVFKQLLSSVMLNHHLIPFPWTISIRYMDIQIFIKQIQGR